MTTPIHIALAVLAASDTRRGGDGVELLAMGLADRIVRLKRESPRGGVNLDAGEEGGRGAGGGDPLLDSALDLLRCVCVHVLPR